MVSESALLPIQVCAVYVRVANVRSPNFQPATSESPLKERKQLGRPWYHVITGQKEMPAPNPVELCKRSGNCKHGTWPNCEHYPYNYNPGLPRWAIFVASILPMGALALSIYALVFRLPYNGFSLPNNFKFPSSISFVVGHNNHNLPPIDPADPNSTVLLWALLFRSVPTYVATLFTSTIVAWIDLNMRFMQPFRNMLGREPKKPAYQRWRDWLGWWRFKSIATDDDAEPEEVDREPAKAAESILLAYITVSPLQVPLTAWDNGHIKVCIYSTLNTLSPLFPIFVGGLLTVTPADKSYKKVDFSFSLSAYIGIMVSLALYSILLPAAMPGAYRLLPRQLYSLADLMAMCHESRFVTSPSLNITYTPSKQHMEAQLLLADENYLFGAYKGRDGHRHIGFDVTTTENPVVHIPPQGFASRLQRSTTLFLEKGLRVGRTMTDAMTGNRGSPFSQRRHGVRPEEIYEMSGGLGHPPATANASGSEPQQAENSSQRRRTSVV
jgi:hypothetical protein